MSRKANVSTQKQSSCVIYAWDHLSSVVVFFIFISCIMCIAFFSAFFFAHFCWCICRIPCLLSICIDGSFCCVMAGDFHTWCDGETMLWLEPWRTVSTRQGAAPVLWVELLCARPRGETAATSQGRCALMMTPTACGRSSVACLTSRAPPPHCTSGCSLWTTPASQGTSVQEQEASRPPHPPQLLPGLALLTISPLIFWTGG